MDNPIICLCEDTVDGLFSAIYRAWEIGTSKTIIEIKGTKTMSLFGSYQEIETDCFLAKKVSDTIIKKISYDAFTQVYRAALSSHPDKGQYIYDFLIKGFKTGEQIIHQLQDETVMHVFELSRQVGFEAHRHLGFIRFVELENGVLLSKIQPKSNILPEITAHFSDRLFKENWIIFDQNRSFSALYQPSTGVILTYDLTEDALNHFSKNSDSEEYFYKLWKNFESTISIQERKNLKLQQQMMPLRYRY